MITQTQGIAKHLDRQVSAVGLALFRIGYGSVLLAEVLELFRFRHLVFDSIPYSVGEQFSHTPLFLLWVPAIICLTIGFWTRYAAVINYTISVAILSVMGDYEYHVDYIYIAVNCLLIVVPTAQCLSVDDVLQRATQRDFSRRAERVPLLYYQVLVLGSVGLVYADSVYWKCQSHVWTAGLGVWLPASLPHFTWAAWPVLLNYEVLVKTLSHLTLAFEGVFVVLIWFSAMRLWITIIGSALHVGIAMVFPIPYLMGYVLDSGSPKM